MGRIIQYKLFRWFVFLVFRHNDLPWNIRKFVHNQIQDFNFSSDLRKVEPWSRSLWSHTDLLRLQEGMVGCQVRLLIFCLFHKIWLLNCGKFKCGKWKMHNNNSEKYDGHYHRPHSIWRSLLTVTTNTSKVYTFECTLYTHHSYVTSSCRSKKDFKAKW